MVHIPFGMANIVIQDGTGMVARPWYLAFRERWKKQRLRSKERTDPCDCFLEMKGAARRTGEVKRPSLIERRCMLAFGDGFKLSARCQRPVTNIKISVCLGRQERLQMENTTMQGAEARGYA